MSIEQICDYLNEIGILDINNIKNYLTMATNIINDNSSNKSIKEIYKISLFAYLKGINNNDQSLYFLCTNIINSYSRYILIKKYDFLCNLKRILYYRILQRFKNFMISLYKVFPFKNHNSNNNYKNKKSQIKNNTFNNAFYSKKNNLQNLTENSNKEKYFNKNKFIPKGEPEIKSSKKISNNNSNLPQLQLERDNFQITNKKIYKEVPSSKKISQINIDMCIAQSNINFEKYFINKRNIICKKCRPSYVEIIKNNKKELYQQKNNFLRKNKSETKLRIKKMDYEEKTRSQNLAKIKPEMKRKLEKIAKSKKDQEHWEKYKEDELYNKITEKTIDEKIITDRLYKKYIIEKKKKEREQRIEENNKIKKPPIIWEQRYLQTNDKIIKKNKNNHIKNKTCSYFMPHRGRVYKYEESEKINSEKVNKDKKNEQENKDEKIEKEINNKNIEKKEGNKDKLDIETNNEKDKVKELNNKDSNPNDIYEIKENDLKNFINNKKEDSKSKENKINDKINDCEDKLKKISTNSLFESIDDEEKIKDKRDNFSISPGGFKSKQLQELLKKNLNSHPLNDLKKINIDDITKESNIFSIESDSNEKNSQKKVNENENKENLIKAEDKLKFDDLLCSEKKEE